MFTRWIILVALIFSTNSALCAQVPKPAKAQKSENGTALLKPITTRSAWHFLAHEGAQILSKMENGTVLIDVINPGTAVWHVQASQNLVGLKPNHRYILTLRVRANCTFPVGLYLTTPGDTPHDVGLNTTVNAGLEWQTFRQPFTTKDVPGKSYLLQLQLGGTTGKVRIAAISLTEDKSPVEPAVISLVVKPAVVPAPVVPAPVVPAPVVPKVPLIPPGRALLPDGSFDYRFDGRISRGVLENFLARAVSEENLLQGRGNTRDNLRMLKNIGAKLVGRCFLLWGGEAALPRLLPSAQRIARSVHAADPEIILQAGAFEIVTRQVEQLSIPQWVFQDFSLPVESRPFRYEDMLSLDGRLKDHWGKEMSVPDMSRLETRLWFFYLGASYIDIGVEALHFGQVGLMSINDPNHVYWNEMLSHLRRYATTHARRHFVLCDAHVPNGGILVGDKLLFDSHAFPLRIKENPDRAQEATLQVGFVDSIYGRSKGGITPSGWACEHLPYLVELDNWAATGHEGQIWHGDNNPIWIWGYDEIGWFAHQDKAYRNEWLNYSWNWVREHDLNGYVEMPGSRNLAAPVSGNIRWYLGNTPSNAVPTGFDQERTIKGIWARDSSASVR